MAKNTSVVTNNQTVTSAGNASALMQELQAKLAEAAKLRAQVEEIEKQTNSARLAELDKFRAQAREAVKQFRLLASAGEVQILHAELFPRKQSDKPRKARTPKAS